MSPNNSFKPNLLRYSNGVAEKACHAVASTTQVGLTQALGPTRTMSGLLIDGFLKYMTRPWFWADLLFVAIGMILLLPLILRRRSRKQQSELLSYEGLFVVGLGALAVVWAGFFVYNRVVAH